jgi:hypothetical protein
MLTDAYYIATRIQDDLNKVEFGYLKAESLVRCYEFAKDSTFDGNLQFTLVAKVGHFLVPWNMEKPLCR